ncbi:DUF4198 domain-containing protein [Pseudodesulfovibrio sp.]|uniref:DUF4198 domain-containing protein n=1 Tax=unclassified Pseudodesulfovibrio TaxID=2661612 RepID=UPI003AFF877F
MRRWGIGLIGLLALLFVGVGAASAHSLYIESGRHRVDEGKRTPLFFCFGHHFPVDDGVRANKLAFVRVYGPSGAVDELKPRPETGLQSQMVTYDKAGTYVLAAETNPGFYTKWVDKKGRDRSTIKPMSAVKDKADKILKSLYSKQYAKSYVRCGPANGIFQARVGLGLELVPSQDPTTLKPGDTLTLKVFRDGARYDGPGHWDATYDGFSTESEDLYLPGGDMTGDTVSIPLDKAGRWFIRYYVKTDAPADKQGEYLQMKQTATLVVLVPNERRRPRKGTH